MKMMKLSMQKPSVQKPLLAGQERAISQTVTLSLSTLRWPALILSGILAACGARSPDTGDSASNPASAAQANIDKQLACIASNPWLEYGNGVDGTSSRTVPDPASTAAVSSVPECKDASNYRVGMGKADITGAASGKVLEGVESPGSYTGGIWNRQYARTAIIESPCNGKRIALISLDEGMFFESGRQGVLAAIAADPDLAGVYSAENLMMNATHTHSGPGGDAIHPAYNLFRLGHDAERLETLVSGIMVSLRQAHAAFNNNAPGQVLLNQGELLGANKNRAIPSYSNNSEAERNQYVDDAGNPVYEPKLMSLLKFVGSDDTPLGSFNWFGVHPTADTVANRHGPNQPISGDNKGYASLVMERLLAEANPEFVSAFAQTNEGDVFTNIWFDDREKYEEELALLPADELRPVTIVSGQKQLLKAMELFNEATDRLHGPVDYRLRLVQMDQQEVTDPVILASLQHPAELDADPKRTCAAALGVSFPSGGAGARPGEVAGGQAPAGVTCSDPDAAQAVSDDLQTLFAGGVPPNLFAATVGCNAGSLPGTNLACHAEKPILFPLGPPLNGVPNTAAIHIFRIGNFALVGLPWEITTMAGRRIRDTVLAELKVDGVDYVVIKGLSDGYFQYLTTREEYAIQQYEGASNLFGPWTLAVLQQNLRELALDMVNGRQGDIGSPVTLPVPIPGAVPPQGSDTTPPGTDFGDVVKAPDTDYVQGDTVRVVFQASSPNSDLKIDGSFLFVEQQIGNDWEVVALDSDLETNFIWHTDTPEPAINAATTSTAEILWKIPRTQPPGTFRIRFESEANQGGVLTPYEGISPTFVVDGPVSDCP